jgi:adenylate cyclase
MPETQTRRLAAVLVTDLVVLYGLTVTEEDEAGVRAALRKLNEEVFDLLIEAHSGRTVKRTDDFSLAEFASVVDAVNCAVAMQRAMAAREAGGVDLKLRVGVNLGDVIVESEGAEAHFYGDGSGDAVVVALRLHSLADLGEICVSKTVLDHAAGKTEAAFEPMGAMKLKSIAEPVEAFRVRLDDATPLSP